jgi:hypothetical protein
LQLASTTQEPTNKPHWRTTCSAHAGRVVAEVAQGGVQLAPELNPAAGIWSLLKRAMVNFAATDLSSLIRMVKRKLKKIQYRPHLIDGCLAGTGLTIEPW